MKTEDFNKVRDLIELEMEAVICDGQTSRQLLEDFLKMAKMGNDTFSKITIINANGQIFKYNEDGDPI